MAKKGSVKWNIPEVLERRKSPRTPRSARSVGDSVSERYAYTDTFEEPSHSHLYTDTFLSESQDSYSDSFVNGSTGKSSSRNGQSDIQTVISTAVSRGDTHIDTAFSATEAIVTVIEVGTEAIDTAVSETAIDTLYSETHPPETYTDTFDTYEHTEDDYSQTESGRSLTKSYTEGSQRSYSYSKTDRFSGSTSFGEKSTSPRYTEDESYTEDDYSYTFEPTEISSQVHLVDPAEIERETEIQLQTEVAQKDFIELTIQRLKRDRSIQPTKPQLSHLNKKEGKDKYVSHYCKKKIKLLRNKQKNGDIQIDKENGPHPLESAKPTQITDYGLSPIVLERMKIKRTLSAMEKAAKEEYHEPRHCQTCREKKAELDALEAEKLFTQSRAKALQNKIIDAQVEEHLLKMNSVSMIAEIARSLPKASEKPEKIMDQLFEPLLGKNVVR